MPGVLFWNVHMRTPDPARVRAMEDTIVEIVSENDCDIIVLAEYGADTAGLCDKLSLPRRNYTERISPYSRIKILSNAGIESEPVSDCPYYAIHYWNMAGTRFLLGGVHLPSKQYGGPRSQSIDLGRRVREAAALGYEKIVLVGDFNANPFEDVLVGFDNLHAVFDAETVRQKRSRVYEYRERPLFYNPSWALLGERNCPKGSCWYGGSESYQIYWNVFDQVIMSEKFMDLFQRDSLKLIAGTRSRRFLTRSGKPDKERYSDHLPLYFTFQEG